MVHKTLVNGTAFEISGGKTLVNGTAYSIKNGKTLVGGTAYEVSFSKPLNEYAIGDLVSLNVNGIPTKFIVVHHGLPSSLYDSSCNGTWLLMKDCYTSMSYSDSSEKLDYADSNVHKYLNNTFFNLLDDDIKSVTKQIKLPYCDGDDKSIKSGGNGLSTKIFSLGGREVGLGSAISWLPEDSVKLDYFIEGDDYKSEARERRNVSGSKPWWLRTPSPSSLADYVVNVSYGGTFGKTSTTTVHSVRPALILPSDTIL